ncbi:chorismate synthase [Caldibacillus thermolactis]|jgi:chorismate synthase|uniref:Chorismate synthase n=1 Tax=Pallidibacillus thermolactis TaxID=251051 RepID=A0ABT2WDG3_9BACI|nr:chorismate synthase [Pallidibacillus thermolactis]MCU9593698.1 chorismate synthase [Pallidibacillus thermolactis]
MRYLTAGESHGPGLTVIIEGLPAGLSLTAEEINESLRLRQGGYGRGRRMQIEKDQVKITAGVRHGKTIGSPVSFFVENKDWKHWTDIMGIEPIAEEEEKNLRRVVTRPRPGHADLNGGIKYGHRDLRNVLERSSARETAARVAVGAVAKILLKELGVQLASHVVEIGGVKAESQRIHEIEHIKEIADQSPVRCLDPDAAQKMMNLIDETKKNGNSIGGIVEVIADGMPPGVGSHVHYDRKLDARIAGAVVSINAFKGVEFGIGFEAARQPGSEVHDEIIWSEEQGYYRKTNRLGGFEGGMTTGMPIVVRGVMKPIPTLYKPLMSVDIETKEPFKASVERSDACAVPAASVVCEHVVAWELACALTEQFYSDQMEKMKEQINEYRRYAREF